MDFLSLFPLFYYLRVGKGKKMGGLKRNVTNGWKPSKCGNIPFSIRIGSLERFAGKWECVFSTVYSETLFQLCKPPWFWVAVLLETFGFFWMRRETDILTVCGYLKMFSQKSRLVSSLCLGPTLSGNFHPACLESHLASVTYPFCHKYYIIL